MNGMKQEYEEKIKADEEIQQDFIVKIEKSNENGTNAEDEVKLERSSVKAKRRPVQLYNEESSVLEKAVSLFQLMEESTYDKKWLAMATHEVMACDCLEEWNGQENTACGEESGCINRTTLMECTDSECNCGLGCANQRFQKREYAPVDVFATEKKGFGLRAMATLQKNDFVYEYIGEVIDEENFSHRMQQYDEEGIKHFYFMMLQKGEFIDATRRGCLARFCNHSCNPNCFVNKWMVGDKLRMGIFTKRGIVAGEELTFDYNVDRYGAQAQPCYCGEPNCIGFIGGRTQTEASIKLPQNVVEALGVEAFEDWSRATAKKRRKRKDEEADEDYVDSLQPQAVSEEGVTTIMQVLLQNKEQWIVSKLVTRISLADDPVIQRRVMKLHGYKILGAVLNDWKHDNVIVSMVLQVLSQWPRITRNKISSSSIESTVMVLSTSEDEKVQALSLSLLSEWGNLEMAYRIPRKKFVPQPPQDTPTQQTTPEKAEKSPSTPRRTFPARTFRRFRRESGKIEPGKPEEPDARELPPGWIATRDDNGRIYYFHEDEGRAQWEFPEERRALPPIVSAEKSALQEIIDEAQRQLRIELKDTKPEVVDEKKKHRPRSRKEEWTRLFAGYVPNVIAKYQDNVSREDLKRYAKEIVVTLVEKEEKREEETEKEKPLELSEEKKRKIKTFARTYMDKILVRRREKESKHKREHDRHEKDRPTERKRHKDHHDHRNGDRRRDDQHHRPHNGEFH